MVQGMEVRTELVTALDSQKGMGLSMEKEPEMVPPMDTETTLETE
jgi:hypothetical protein